MARYIQDSETDDLVVNPFHTHRRIFCEVCREETLWFPNLAFDYRNAYEPIIVASCCECGMTKKATVLTEYDRQMRYLHGGDTE